MAKGRNRSRLHVQFGPDYKRDQKVCVTTEVSQETLEKIAGAIQQFLEQTLPEPGRKKSISPRSHTTIVRFVLGKDHIDLGVTTAVVSLQMLRDGTTEGLFERILSARKAACERLQSQGVSFANEPAE